MPISLSPALNTDAIGYYADQSDMENRFGAENVSAWSNVSGDLSIVNVPVLQDALDDADLLIDEILRMNGFQTPLATTSVDYPRMTDVACDLALAKLMDKRMLRTDPPDGMGREMWFKVKNAKARLLTLVRGGLTGTRMADTVNGCNCRQPQSI